MRINRISGKVIRGSLTVEAALVLPVFLYIIIAFLYFLQILRIQEILQAAITETGFFTARYAYVYDYIEDYGKEDTEETNTENAGSNENKAVLEYESHGDRDETREDRRHKLQSSAEAALARSIDSAYFKIKMQDYLDVNLINHLCIKNGIDGIHTYMSSFMKEEAIDIILSYDIRLPLLFIHIEDIPVMQRVRMRGWSGHEVVSEKGSSDSDGSDGDSEKMVYITETGNAYHLYRDCTYLKLSIREVNIDQINTLRNDSGGKYTECSLCGGSIPPGSQKVYITNTGDRYHWDLNCSGLKRTIIKIPVSEVGDRHLCNRCRAERK